MFDALNILPQASLRRAHAAPRGWRAMPLVCAVVLLAAHGFYGAQAHADDLDNEIHTVSMEPGDDATVLRFVGTQEATFSVFTLRNPQRIFVDIANSLPAEHVRGVIDGEGVIESVSISAYNDALAGVTRIVVILRDETYFDVYTEGDALVLVVDDDSGAFQAPIVRAETVAVTGASSADANADADAMQARIRALEAELQSADARRREAIAASSDSTARLAELEAELSARDARIQSLQEERTQGDNGADSALEISRMQATLLEREQQLELALARADAEVAAPEAREEALARANELEARLARLEADNQAALAEAMSQRDIAQTEAAERERELRDVESRLIASERERVRMVGETVARQTHNAAAELGESRSTTATAPQVSTNAPSDAVDESDVQRRELDELARERARVEAELRDLQAEVEAERQRAERAREAAARGAATTPEPAAPATPTPTEPAPPSALLGGTINDASRVGYDDATPAISPRPTDTSPEQSPASPPTTSADGHPSSVNTDAEVQGRTPSRGESTESGASQRESRCRAVGTNGRARWVPCPR